MREISRRAATGLIMATAAVPTLARAAAPVAPDTVFQDLVPFLDGYDRATGPAGTNVPLYGAELSLANGHAAPVLLEKRIWDANIATLEAYRKLGMRVVKISIPYPILEDTTPHSAEYLDFYKRIAKACRDRGFAINVTLQFMFPQPSFNPLHVSYEGTTVDTLKAAQTRLLAKVIDAMAPEWVTLFNEPSTQAANTGHKEFLDPKFLTGYLTDLIKSAPKSTTKIGAGTGDWDKPEYVKAILDAPIDYFDLHIYPINPEFAAKPRELIATARAAGKRVFIGEAWLLKNGPERDEAGSYEKTVVRDTYPNASADDQRFVEITARLATLDGVDGLTFFWSRYFFSYLDPAQIEGKSPPEVMRDANAAAYNALMAGQISPTGAYYGKVISRYGAKA